MKIYVGHKMRGLPATGYPWFADAAAFLRSLGHDPITPPDIDIAYGESQGAPHLTDTEVGRHFLRRDFAVILGLDPVVRGEPVDAVAFGPLWYDSYGSRAEREFARWIGLPIYAVTPHHRSFVQVKGPHDATTVLH